MHDSQSHICAHFSICRKPCSLNERPSTDDLTPHLPNEGLACIVACKHTVWAQILPNPTTNGIASHINAHYSSGVPRPTTMVAVTSRGRTRQLCTHPHDTPLALFALYVCLSEMILNSRSHPPVANRTFPTAFHTLFIPPGWRL